MTVKFSDEPVDHIIGDFDSKEKLEAALRAYNVLGLLDTNHDMDYAVNGQFRIGFEKVKSSNNLDFTFFEDIQNVLIQGGLVPEPSTPPKVKSRKGKL